MTAHVSVLPRRRKASDAISRFIGYVFTGLILVTIAAAIAWLLAASVRGILGI